MDRSGSGREHQSQACPAPRHPTSIKTKGDALCDTGSMPPQRRFLSRC